MKRPGLIVGAAVVIAVIWISTHTYWADAEWPVLPKGEALTNPFYATQRFAEALGAQTTHDRLFTTPPAGAIIVLSLWNWTVSDRRRTAIERWVESGGRLVVDRSLIGDQSEFERWSGIVHTARKTQEPQTPHRSRLCDRFREGRTDGSGATSNPQLHWICDYDALSSLSTSGRAAWTLAGNDGVQAMRVGVGKGSVTVINASPFRARAIFDGDHGWLFVAATQLRRGDEVHFLSEEEHPSLVGLIWSYGKPVVLLASVLIGFALWRTSVRLGPLIGPPPPERRSLTEQIRASGWFAVRHGGGEALHAASARALEEEAARRVSGYQQLTPRDRAARIAELTGWDRDGLNEALHHPGRRQPNELRSTIERLEQVRRMLLQRTGPDHGTS